MTVSEYEGNLNGKLCSLLKDSNLKAGKEVKRGSGRVDILVLFEGYDVAIECEKDGPNKETSAIKDAMSRLEPGHVNIAFAVVYPPDCTEETLDLDTVLKVVVLDRDHVGTQRGQKSLNEYIGPTKKKPIIWMERSVKDVIEMIRSTHRDLGNPDRIVKDLNYALDTATSYLTENECRLLGESLNLTMKKKGGWTPAAKRALLVIASAAMFHARLDPHLDTMKPIVDARTGTKFKGNWPPASIQECYEDDNTPARLLDSWQLILAVDYKPIFEAGRHVLKSNNSTKFTQAVKTTINWARYAVGQLGGLRHDILGRIFHAMLEDAKYDGSFYTSVPSAIVLAGLALRNKQDIPKKLSSMKIIDPACGTGTLLMAAAERIRDILGDKYNSKTMIEKVLTGIDINVTALHMAATTLGLMSPTTQFKNMNVRMAPFGQLTDTTVATGSLEMYSPEGLLPSHGFLVRDVMDRDQSLHIETGQKDDFQIYHNTANLVIMNPPFTRSDIRHDQLGKVVEKLVKSREKLIYRGAPFNPSQTSSGQMFLMLAERLANKNNSVVALVLPLTASMNPTTQELRAFLAQKFHIETIVVSDDPNRFWFSENTDIAEMLIVMRRNGKPKRHTNVIHLAINPNTATDAATLVSDILSKKPRKNIQIIKQSKKVTEAGDWYGVQFFSPYLTESFLRIRESELFKATHLKNIASISPSGRHLSMYAECSDVSGKYGWRSLYNNKTSILKSMEVSPYTYIVPKKGKLKKAEEYWASRSILLVPIFVQPNLARPTAVISTVPTIGVSWTSVRPYESSRKKEWSLAMAMYFNSTIGIVSLLGVRIPKKPLFPRFSVENHAKIPIPILSPKQIDDLAGAYKNFAMKKIGLWRESDDPIRSGIDAVVSSSLKINIEYVNNMRFELSREPMCTGERYKPILNHKVIQK